MPEPFRVDVASQQSTTALIYPAATKPPAGVTLILGHGAGAGQTSDFMTSFAGGLAARGVDTITFNFLYRDQGRHLPDSNDRLEACWRAVIEAVRQRIKPSRNALAIGGKSMGGRIASQVAAGGIGNLAGLVLLGYPLHPPGRPEQRRDAHLPRVSRPMLIVQGSREIIVSDWSRQQAEWDQQRWVYLFGTGLVTKAEAELWADEVWGDHREEDNENDRQAEQSVDRGSSRQ